MTYLRQSLWMLALAALAGCNPGSPSSRSDDTPFLFAGRPLALDSLLMGFPFRLITASYDAGALFYIHRGDADTLKRLKLGSGKYLTEGRALAEIDFSKRNISGIRYRPADSSLYWLGDEANEESFNLFRVPAHGGKPEKITDEPYLFGWDWTPDKATVAYVFREGNRELRKGRLHLLHLDDLSNRLVATDQAALRFTWGPPRWNPYSAGLIVNTLRRGDRNFANLVYLDLKSGRQTLVTDSTRPRSNVEALTYWPSGSEFLYLSNETGYRNVFSGSIYGRNGRQLTFFDTDIQRAEPFVRNGQTYLFIIRANPRTSILAILDPRSGRTLAERAVPGEVSLLDIKDYRALIQVSSATAPFRMEEVSLLEDTLLMRAIFKLPEALSRKLVHAGVEAVKFPTFDTVAGDSVPRMLHGYLYKPLKPLPASQTVVMVQSFYGGENRYSLQPHLFAAAGIHVFSPAPRGSSGFGRAFAALNDKDLGGNEIVDVIFAARYIAEKLGASPERIGVFGGSHGGYAAMRLLTFPGEINGVQADFPWGFGISHAGFSDIIDFYHTSNIPDWVTLEAGDPESEADKLRDRSPLYHAARAKGPLLLTHGVNDNRVPIQGSRAMNDSLLHYGKPVTLIEFPGQGHSIQGLENQRAYYQIWLQFIEEAAGLKPGRGK